MSNDTLKIARKGLKAAHQFITNGIEFGYIKMPDADMPDPAHDTPHVIANALTAIEAQVAQATLSLTDEEIENKSYLYCTGDGPSFEFDRAALISFARDLLSAAIPAPQQPMSEGELRAEFERQHADRNLTRHHLRGTYVSANIAALWNQHARTAAWLLKKPAAQQPKDAA